jgi:hypothetical protein
LFVHEVVDVGKGDLENKLVRTVPDARDGSAKFPTVADGERS